MPLANATPLPLFQTPQIDGGTILLPVPWYPTPDGLQEWCWAACAQMMAYYFQNTPTEQCTFANSVFPGLDCCNSPDACNLEINLDQVTALFGSFGKTATYVEGQIGPDEIQAEIAASRPVQVGFQWSTGDHHLVVIAGVSQDDRGLLVYVNDPDPQFAYGWVYYSNLQIAYGLGSWQWTWKSIA